MKNPEEDKRQKTNKVSLVAEPLGTSSVYQKGTMKLIRKHNKENLFLNRHQQQSNWKVQHNISTDYLKELKMGNVR